MIGLRSHGHGHKLRVEPRTKHCRFRPKSQDNTPHSSPTSLTCMKRRTILSKASLVESSHLCGVYSLRRSAGTWRRISRVAVRLSEWWRWAWYAAGAEAAAAAAGTARSGDRSFARSLADVTRYAITIRAHTQPPSRQQPVAQLDVLIAGNVAPLRNQAASKAIRLRSKAAAKFRTFSPLCEIYGDDDVWVIFSWEN